MQLTLNLENLEQLVKDALEENLNSVIEQEVRNVITAEVNESAKEIIETRRFKQH